MMSLRNHLAVKTVAVLLCMVLPCSIALFLSGALEAGVLNVLWCGFYGVILTWICSFPWWIKLVAAVINFSSFCVIGLGFLMGGWGGLMWLVGKAVLPFAF